jgi:hypothetical protein
MRLTRPRFTVRGLMVVVGLSGLALGLYGWVARRAEALRVEAANRAAARKQLAVIDKAWDLAHFMAQSARIGIADGPFSLWGRRRLEALHRAGAGKAEIIAALEKYINSLKELEKIANAREEFVRSDRTTLDVYELQSLRMEAEIWLNEEKAR